jgi:hypothetical protein
MKVQWQVILHELKMTGFQTELALGMSERRACKPSAAAT